MGTHTQQNSLETILTFNNRELSDWSVVWSTTHVPGMDTATGSGSRRRMGRRRLRIGTLAVGTFLTMHCKVTACAITGGFFTFMMFLILSVLFLANPLRHFEIYLGQWSISGPGRAFRIIPMFDGIGIAICINAIVRAIICSTQAAIAALYVAHSVADSKLPFTYCRDFDLIPYDPMEKDVNASLPLIEVGYKINNDTIMEYQNVKTTVGLSPLAWRNVTINPKEVPIARKSMIKVLLVCKETYSDDYPALYSTPAYNFFYVEIMHYRKDSNKTHINLNLLICIILVWSVIWLLLIIEKITHGRLIWNNIYSWFASVPWLWSLLLLSTSFAAFFGKKKPFKKVFEFGTKDLLSGISDALQVSLYIHAASIGTELILGKGLNHYASGHIDPHLNAENVWNSGFLIIMLTMTSGGSALCGLIDFAQTQNLSKVSESSLWVFPMYSKCTSLGSYSHLISVLIFAGLMFSYVTVAFVLVKTALHTIFEYRVKLVFIEQVIVAVLILVCTGLSIIFTTNNGLPLFEAVEALMTGVAMPFICALEMFGLIYVYRSHDFMSDMNISTEENACSTRLGIQWQVLPFIALVLMIMKIVLLIGSEIPSTPMYFAIAPVVAVMVAVPLRACHNAYVFLRPAPRRGV